MTATQIAEVAGFSKSNPSAQPNKWKKEGHIFAVRHRGIDYFPGYALDSGTGYRPIKTVAKVLRIFGERKDGWGPAYWFALVNGLLGPTRAHCLQLRWMSWLARSIAKPKTGTGRKQTIASTNDVPAPPKDLLKTVEMMVWPEGQIIHRIHLDLYQGAQFNQGVRGNAGFSPIRDAMRASVPTPLWRHDFDCAAMETVFHDAPFATGLKSYDKQKVIGHVYSQVAPQRDLALADLSSTALRRHRRPLLGIAARRPCPRSGVVRRSGLNEPSEPAGRPY